MRAKASAVDGVRFRKFHRRVEVEGYCNRIDYPVLRSLVVLFVLFCVLRIGGLGSKMWRYRGK